VHFADAFAADLTSNPHVLFSLSSPVIDPRSAETAQFQRLRPSSPPPLPPPLPRLSPAWLDAETLDAALETKRPASTDDDKGGAQSARRSKGGGSGGAAWLPTRAVVAQVVAGSEASMRQRLATAEARVCGVEARLVDLERLLQRGLTKVHARRLAASTAAEEARRTRAAATAPT
jgi:hypothetical protein